MLAVLAVIFFAEAFVLRDFAHSAEKIVVDVEILGFLCIAAHLAWGWGVPLVTSRRTPRG